MTRIHIMGASGSGTTTFGRALASSLSISHFDVDDFYWRPTSISFTEKRDVAERLRLMQSLFLDRDTWVLSGSLTSWSKTLISYFDLVIFIELDDKLRLERLQKREALRYGVDAIARGGKDHERYEAFIEWAARYESSDFTGRSRVVHEQWLQTLECPVLRLKSIKSLTEMVLQTHAFLVAGSKFEDDQTLAKIKAQQCDRKIQ